MKSKRKLKMGVISFEFGHQEAYAALLINSPEIELVAIGDYSESSERSKSKCKQWASMYGVEFYPDYHEMAQECDLDIVSIAVPPSKNPEIVEFFAQNKISIICEKPVAINLDGMKIIQESVTSNNIKFTFCCPAAKFTKPFLDTLTLISSDSIGEPMVANYMYLQPKGPLYIKNEEQIKSEPFGELANFCGYGVLLLNEIFKQPILSVYAEADAFFYPTYKKHNIEDFGIVTMTYKDGGLATMIIGRTTTQAIPHTDLRLEVIGSNGAINVNNGNGNRIFTYEDHKDSTGWNRGGYNWDYYEPSCNDLFILDFINSIVNGQKPRIGIEDAVLMTSVQNAIYMSLKNHQVVNF